MYKLIPNIGMMEENVNPIIFTWTIKIATAVMTFITGAIIYLHRKIYAIDKVLAVNEERNTNRQIVVEKIQTTVDEIRIDQKEIMTMFHEQHTRYNNTENQRIELADLIVSQKETIEDIQKLRKMKTR